MILSFKLEYAGKSPGDYTKIPFLQYFGHLIQRAGSLEKTLMIGKFEVKRTREWQRMRWLDRSPTQWT